MATVTTYTSDRLDQIELDSANAVAQVADANATANDAKSTALTAQANSSNSAAAALASQRAAENVQTMVAGPTEEVVRTVFDIDLDDEASDLKSKLNAKFLKRDESFTSATDHGVTTGATDNSLALQSIFSNLTPGTEFKLPPGNYNFAGTLTIPISDVTIHISKGANLIHTGIGQDAIVITGDRVRVKGPGTITSPAHFDADTGGTDHYAVIHVKGNDCVVSSTRLVNIQNVGIYFDDCDRIQAYNNEITGNFPMASFINTNTGHFGIAYNAGTETAATAGVIMGGFIDSCVQGIFIGNYGGRGPQAGLVITGVTFSNCHNHGIYHDDSGNPAAISGNTFTDCQIPIVVLGPGHAIKGNVIWVTAATPAAWQASFTYAVGDKVSLPNGVQLVATVGGTSGSATPIPPTTTTGTVVDGGVTWSTYSGTADQRVGINMRNSVGCVVSGNTLKGFSAGSIVINFTHVNGGTTIARNTVTGNIVDIVDLGVLVAFGTGATTVLIDNVVTGNVLRGQGSNTTGLVTFSPAAGANTQGNKFNNNDLVIIGSSHGVWVNNMTHMTIQGNSIRLEYNAAATVQKTLVLLTASSKCKVSDNDYICPSGYGANINLRGTSEAGACSGNRIVQNDHDAPVVAGGVLSYIAFFPIAGSEAYMDESGLGVPTRQCCAGSRWSRSDGGAGTSFYIKESNSTVSTGWVGMKSAA